jgi:SagB-type dehydrogenase family enzyme
MAEDGTMTTSSHPERSRIAWLAGLAVAASVAAPTRAQQPKAPITINLPAPQTAGEVSVERALENRRSVRSFAAAPLALAEVGQLLWAAQGITDQRGHRTAPSAGGLYPLELYLVAGNITGLPAGVYRYRPTTHELVLAGAGDCRTEVAAACRQSWVATAPATVAFTAVFARTAKRYGDRSSRYVPIEVGAAAENLALQAVALGLGTTFVGAFDDSKLATALGAAADERVLALVPVGRR